MKKLLVFGFAVAAASLASASTLYWQVDDSAGGGYTTYSEKTAAVNLYAVKDGGFNIGSTATFIQEMTKTDVGGWEYLANLDSSYDSSTYSFFVELTDSNNKRLAASQLASVEALQTAGAYYTGGMSTAATSVYNFTGFSSNVIPEPTSGMLVMLGALMLGLRRKKELV